MKKKKKSPLFFVAVFVVLAAIIIVQNLLRETEVHLSVPDNAGVSFLKTVGNSLVCVFQDGEVAAWDWTALPHEQSHFSVNTDRIVLLDEKRLAAVNKAGKKILTVYTLSSGQKQKEVSVGWEDQDVWPRISFDKSVVALIRKNPADSAGKMLYEFLTVDIGKELSGIPVSLSIQTGREDLIDYAVDGNAILYAVGSQDMIGRITAVDLEKGGALWDKSYEQTLEFCSVIASPDNQYLLAGNRDGILYKLDAKTGEILKKIQLLKKGEMRQVTNDYSVLSLAYSNDGQYFVSTIIPTVYFFKAETDEQIYRCAPADRLISKTVFSCRLLRRSLV